jgi:hypothetical protein
MDAEHGNGESGPASLNDPAPETPAKVRRGVLGKRRRSMVLILTMIGIASFVSPLIRTDSQVLGRTRWSPLQIVIQLHRGTLPDCRSYLSTLCEDNPRAKLVFMTLDAVAGFGTGYAMLLAIVMIVVLFPRAELVGAAAVIGAIAVGKNGQYGYDDLQDFFGGGHHAHGRALELALVGIFVLMIWIAVTKALDD